MDDRYQHANDPKPNLMEKVEQITVPVQGHYGAEDPIVSLDTVRQFEQALRANGTPASFFTYGGATHGFYDSTRAHYRRTRRCS